MASRKRLVMVMQRGTPYQSTAVGFRDIASDLSAALASMGRIFPKKRSAESALHFLEREIRYLQGMYASQKHGFSDGTIELFHVRERRGMAGAGAPRAFLYKVVGKPPEGRKKRRKRSLKASKTASVAFGLFADGAAPAVALSEVFDDEVVPGAQPMIVE